MSGGPPPYSAPLFGRRPSAPRNGLGLSALAGGGFAGGGLAGASSSSSAPTQHTFVFDDELQARLEGSAIKHFPKREKSDNAKFAKENYHLVKQGYYTDVTNQQHDLRLPRDAINKIYEAPKTAGRPLSYRHPRTNVCVARIDTATAMRTLQQTLPMTNKVAALNFANAYHPGGGYLNGARAQEEDLCRLMPTLYSSLKRLKYPMKEPTCFFTQAWLARTAGSYSLDGPPVLVNILSAAMPDLGSWHNKLTAGDRKWDATVRLRMRAVLHAAREEKCETIVLGAFGCGAFANPPEMVAKIFAEVLASDEFRGAFSTVVFAILEFKGSDSGNVAAFVRACGAQPGGLCHQPPTSQEPPTIHGYKTEGPPPQPPPPPLPPTGGAPPQPPPVASNGSNGGVRPMEIDNEAVLAFGRQGNGNGFPLRE